MFQLKLLNSLKTTTHLMVWGIIIGSCFNRQLQRTELRASQIVRQYLSRLVKLVFNLTKIQQEKQYDGFMKYKWKDLLVDAAIVAVVLGVLALIIGSFPATFSKVLPFLKQEWISNFTCLLILSLSQGYYLLS